MSDNDTNPYASPAAESQTNGQIHPSNPLIAPAVILIILSSLMLVSILFTIPAELERMEQVHEAQKSRHLKGTIFSVLAVVTYNAAIVMGAIHMLRLKKRGRAKMGAILACVPICSPLIFLGIPFGIWALVTMNRTEVRSRFSG